MTIGSRDTGIGICTPNECSPLKMEPEIERGFLWTDVLRLCGAIQ
jgi:hypothetical protein